MSRSPRRWIAVVTASAALAATPVVAAPLSPREVRVVDDVHVALAAGWSPEQQAVIDDFHRGGLAEVLRLQGTARLTQPDQIQIIDDFFEGGVIQTEGRRWLGLFHDPQQQAFLQDFLTGGVVQIVRNRLLDATGDPNARAAIIAFFPDEITDYRGGPITMLQRRLIAAAKGNQFVIGLVNAVFDNPVVLTVRRLIGGGPIIGTPLPDLPPLETADSPKAAVATSVATTEAKQPAAPTDSRQASAKPAEPAVDHQPAGPESDPADVEPGSAGVDVIKTGNKVEPTTLAGTDRPKPGTASWGVFGQVAEAVAAGLAGLAGAPVPETAPAPAADGSSDAGTSTDASGEN